MSGIAAQLSLADKGCIVIAGAAEHHDRQIVRLRGDAASQGQSSTYESKVRPLFMMHKVQVSADKPVHAAHVVQVQARIEFLRELQDKHDEYEEQFNEELKALRAKYETLYSARSLPSPCRRNILPGRSCLMSLPPLSCQPCGMLLLVEPIAIILHVGAAGCRHCWCQAQKNMMGCHDGRAAPLYDERKAVVTGEKEVPVDETAPKAAESEGTAAPGEAEKAEEEGAAGHPRLLAQRAAR